MAINYFGEEITPEQAVAERKKAYDKFLNIPLAEEEKQKAQRTQQMRQAMRDVYSGMQQGGFTGRQAASEAMDKSLMGGAELRGQQAAERQGTTMQGAQMKEDIMGAKEQAYMTQFNRQTQEMEEQFNKALAERAFDLGMTAKELAFHTNAQVADIGLAELKKDYDAGNVSRDELTRLQARFAAEAQQAKMVAEGTLADLARQGDLAADTYGKDRYLALVNQYLDAQKEVMKKQAKANNTAAIISGGAGLVGTLGGGLIAGYFTGWNPSAMAAGASVGNKATTTAASAYNSRQNK